MKRPCRSTHSLSLLLPLPPTMSVGTDDTLSMGSLALKAALLVERHAALEEQLTQIAQDLPKVGRRENAELPIAKLPQDLLSKIFALLHSTQTLDSEPPLARPNGSPIKEGDGLDFRAAGTTRRAEVVVSHVSHHWRIVSLQIPTLWSVFWCDKPQTCKALAAEIDRVKTYLSRSALAQDLELYFDFTMITCQPESAVAWQNYRTLASELLNSTVSHSHRWRNLTIIANDSSRRVSLAPFRKAASCVSAPRLERLVVCVGLSYYHQNQGGKIVKEGWEGQVLLLRDWHDGGPCPRLKYLKVDGAGLKHCRPPNHCLTHLFLESGPSSAPPDNGVATTGVFKIDWTVFLSSEILRLPHLEALSLHEDVLDRQSFPLLGRWVQRVKNETLKEFFIELLRLKHLRIGSSYRLYSAPEPRRHEGSFLLFFLRFVSAPLLESLTVCGHLIDSNPWEDSWASLVQSTLASNYEVEKYPTRECFESLKILTLSDVCIASADATKAPFAHLVHRTSCARLVTILQQRPVHDSRNVKSALTIVQERPVWIESPWPEAVDISVGMALPSLSPSDLSQSQSVLEGYRWWCNRVATQWHNVVVFRIPPTWFDVWFSNVQMEEEPWRGNLEGDRVPRGRPIRIAPIEDTASRFWPPDAGSSAFNTLSSELFSPFKADTS